MMKRSWFAVLTALVLAGALPVLAEVKTEEKSTFKLAGPMGRVVGMFAGKAAKDGLISTVAVKGSRKMKSDESAGEIVDLDERKVYTLDLKKKTYEVVTFEEMLRRMKEAQEKATQAMKEQPKQEQQPEGKQMEFDFSLKESGQTRTINGYDCREVVATVTTHEKGKKLEESGGMVMTSHMWYGPEIAAMKEIADFDMRYYKALGEPFLGELSGQDMAAMMAMYPAMKDMMGKVEAEKVNVKGTPILTETTMETVSTAEQAARESKQEKEPAPATSIGGFGGMLGRKLMRKKEEPAPAPPPSSGSPAPSTTANNRTTVMTTNHELVKISTSVAPTDVSIPPGFKEKK
jgi:hypothetical protein